jgi:formate hydrogenlyase subunit 3/multisubunit Na+/H+ antiporter MnhD subunit
VLVAMIRVFVEGLPRYLSTAQTALTAVALVTLLIGGSLVYWQTSFRRLIALVVMVQAGLILLALAAACSEAARPGAVRWIDRQIPGGAGAAWLLFGADSFALLGLAAIASGLERRDGRVDDLEEFSHRLGGDRLIAAATILLLLSLAGIPPLPGFWTRVAVLRSVLSVNFPPENDFLPHQNTGYVVFALLMVAALLAVAAPCLSVAGRILSSQTPIAGASQTPFATGTRGRGGLRFGAAIAALLLALGFVPTWDCIGRPASHFPSPRSGSWQPTSQPSPLKSIAELAAVTLNDRWRPGETKNCAVDLDNVLSQRERWDWIKDS